MHSHFQLTCQTKPNQRSCCFSLEQNPVDHHNKDGNGICRLNYDDAIGTLENWKKFQLAFLAKRERDIKHGLNNINGWALNLIRLTKLMQLEREREREKHQRIDTDRVLGIWISYPCDRKCQPGLGLLNQAQLFFPCLLFSLAHNYIVNLNCFFFARLFIKRNFFLSSAPSIFWLSSLTDVRPWPTLKPHRDEMWKFRLNYAQSEHSDKLFTSTSFHSGSSRLVFLSLVGITLRVCVSVNCLSI